MATNSTKRDRRDWTLIIFLLPIGIIFMVVAGQIAIRLVPNWRVNGGMGSNLDPDSASKNDPGLIPPLSFDILTPMSWFDNFLTPGPGSVDDGVSFPPFVVFEPSDTPSPTASVSPVPSSSTTPTASPTATATSGGSSTPTKKPDNEDPTATTPTATSITSTPEGTSTATPSQLNVGTPDGSVGGVPDGYYIILSLTATPIVVSDPADTNYDFVYYERDTGVDVDMDSVILSISMDNIVYYVVFNWGDDVPDDNSNVGDYAASTTTEDDNQSIPYSELHNNTGILVDVDNAPSNPPAGSYQYLAIQAPLAPVNDGNDGADVDSIEVTEVPIP